MIRDRLYLSKKNEIIVDDYPLGFAVSPQIRTVDNLAVEKIREEHKRRKQDHGGTQKEKQGFLPALGYRRTGLKSFHSSAPRT